MLNATIFITNYGSYINKCNEDIYSVDRVWQGKVKIYYKASVPSVTKSIDIY